MYKKPSSNEHFVSIAFIQRGIKGKKEMELKNKNMIEPKVLPKNSSQNRSSAPKRQRSMTTLNMQWLGERVRKARKIKAMIEAGEYNVDSKLIAQAMLNMK